jgi:hypothetical protein
MKCKMKDAFYKIPKEYNFMYEAENDMVTYGIMISTFLTE